MIIVKSSLNNAEELSEIAKASKAYWNYPQEWLGLWEDDLTITKDFFKENEVFQGFDENVITGFYAYKIEQDFVYLDSLFVHPKYIGKGYGNLLMNDFFNRIQTLEVKKVILDADPYAKTFYEKFGFVEIDKKATKIEGRFLPVMLKMI